MSVKTKRRPGRPPLYAPGEEHFHELHFSIGVELETALKDYCKSLGQRNISVAVRILLLQRLSELGFVKKKFEIVPLSQRTQHDP